MRLHYPALLRMSGASCQVRTNVPQLTAYPSIRNHTNSKKSKIKENLK